MAKLLRAGLRRYLHSIIFWIAFVANIFLGFHAAINARNFMLDDVFIIAEFIVFAVMITWLVSRELDEGIVRNKLICGHTRTQIFISEIVLAICTISVMFLIFATIFTGFNTYIFAKAPTVALVKIFFDVWLVNICFAIIFTVLGLLVNKRAIVAVLNLILVLGIVFASYGLETVLEQKEYWEFYEYEAVITTDENGNTHITSTPIEGSEYLEKNPRYIGGIPREIFKVLYRISPHGHMIKHLNLSLDWFGYNYYELYTDEDTAWENSDKDLTVTKEQMTEMNYDIIWSLAVNTCIITLGYILFRKKEFK